MTQKEYRKLSTLKNWDKNPRSIKEKDFERLKTHIRDFGQMQPLVITPDGTVLGGNMRLRAYNALGMDDIWVQVVEPKDEDDKLRIALILNDRAGYYDGDLLANLTGEYPDFNWEDYAVDLKEPQTLDEILDQYKEVEEDDVPEVSSEPAVSKLGEVYQLGRHRLMCGDATKIEDVEKLMNGQKADMVFTDPPYGMDLDTEYSKLPNAGGGENKDYSRVIGDDKPFDYQLFAWIECAEQVWFGANYYAKTLPDGGSWMVWDKRVDEQFDKMFGSAFELAWSKSKHKQKIYRHNNTLFSGEKEAQGKEHPTQKPTKLCAAILADIGSNEDKVLDLFGGSGSTLIACEQTNRTCYMMELDPKYCDVIRKRYENFTKK